VALNLWKTGGKPTSYNPLTTGYIDKQVPVSVGVNYVVSFYASSASSKSIQLANLTGTPYVNSVPLTPVRTRYTYEFIGVNNWFIIYNNTSATDVIIDSIELVQKPLPKLTINGVDGFTSGKWVLNALATAVDDETLVLNATASYQYSYLLINVTPNTNYSFSVEHNANIGVYTSDGSQAIVSTTPSKTVNFNSGTNAIIRLYLNNGSLGAGQFTFKRPMLNLGTSSVPYSRKTGDRMMLPTPKKNLFNKSTITTGKYIFSGGGTLVDSASGNTASDWIVCKPNVMYSGTNLQTGGTAGTAFYTSSGSFISGVQTQQFTTPNNAYLMRTTVHSSLLDVAQLEEGSTATSYEPFNVQLNKKPNHAIAKERSGTAFNGVTDYLQLPSMTIDSIEIDCLIDSVQPQADPYLVDARTGLTNGYFIQSLNSGSGWVSLTVDGVNKSNKLWTDVPKGQRTKVKLTATSTFSDDVVIFARGSVGQVGQQPLKATLYKVTCYLNGGVVAQYDFENPSNIVGNTVLPKADNLIPSFEDPRWTLHVNTQVLGKNVLRLNSTGSSQSSYFDLAAQPNEVYFGQMGFTNGDVFVRIRDINNTQLDAFWPNLTKKTLPANTASLRLEMRNINTTGTYDFIKPQLFKLDGKEATLNGTPVQLNKPSKRTLYAKR
jgi:hypothetical protein